MRIYNSVQSASERATDTSHQPTPHSDARLRMLQIGRVAGISLITDQSQKRQQLHCCWMSRRNPRRDTHLHLQHVINVYFAPSLLLLAGAPDIAQFKVQIFNRPHAHNRRSGSSVISLPRRIFRTDSRVRSRKSRQERAAKTSIVVWTCLRARHPRYDDVSCVSYR